MTSRSEPAPESSVFSTVRVAADALVEKPNRQAIATPAISSDAQPNRTLPGLDIPTTLLTVPTALTLLPNAVT
jgi:hypothetical protein